MNNRELVDRARTRSGSKSLTELAEYVGVNQSSLSLLASGKGELSDETYIKLAELAGVDPAKVLIEKHARKAGPMAGPIWKQLAKSLPKSAGLVLVLIFCMPLITNEAKANDHTHFQVPLNKYYANLWHQNLAVANPGLLCIYQPAPPSIQINKRMLLP